MSIKVLLDTDIGSDIDDAVCLAYLLANPECELLGITTVSGEAEKRAQMAIALCKVAGREIPIFPGAEKPLLIPQRQPEAPQASALNKWEHDRRFPKGRAISFLRETIYSHPGEIMLLAIGPLTNIALLFSMDPEIPSLLKGLVMMCGVFTNRLAGVGPLEWNAMLDPHATAISYHHDVKMHRSVGLDVTCQVTMAGGKRLGSGSNPPFCCRYWILPAYGLKKPTALFFMIHWPGPHCLIMISANSKRRRFRSNWPVKSLRE